MRRYFTRHARNRMRLYEISETVVLDALAEPDRTTSSVFERRHAWKKLPNGQWLRVTYKDESAVRVIITVTPKPQYEET